MIFRFPTRRSALLAVAGLAFAAISLAGCGEDKAPGGAPAPAQEPAASTPTAGSTAPVTSATPPAQTGSPRIESATALYDMGTIPNDAPGEGEFAIFNRGTAPLVISKVSTSCGCTQGKAVDTTVPPGGQTAIKVTVDPFRIPQFTSRKTLTIITNDPENPQVKVDVVARVEPEIEWDPASLDFGQVERGQAADKTIIVRQLQDAPFDLAAVRVSGAEGFFTATSVLRPEAEWKTPGKREFVISAKLSGDAPIGPFGATVAIETGLPRLKRLTIHAKADIKGPYSIEPRQVVVRDAKAGQTVPAAFRVVSEGPIEFKSIAPTKSDVKVTPHPSDDGKSVTFDLTVGPAPASRLIRDVLVLDIISEGKPSQEKINVLVVLAGDQLKGGASAPTIRPPGVKPLALPPSAPPAKP